MKCPRCGFNQPHWLKQAWDKEAEYCHASDSDIQLQVGETRIIDGFAYRRTSEKYVIRMPLEIFEARGKSFNKPKKYWDATNFNHGHHRDSNLKLGEFNV